MIQVDLRPQRGARRWRVVTSFNDVVWGEVVLNKAFFFKYSALNWAVQESKRIQRETGETVSLMVRDKWGCYQEERTYGRDPVASPG